MLIPKATAVALVAWFAKFVLSAELPNYSGAFDVGIVDIEVPVSQPRAISNLTLKGDGQPALRLETVLFTLYYPIDKGATTSKPQHLWFPEPRGLVANGLTRASGQNFPSSLIESLIKSVADTTVIPAQVDAPLANVKDALPVLVFSHGDVSIGNWYSQFNGQLAANGLIAVVVQHRDGSAAGTVVNYGNGTTRNVSLLIPSDVNPTVTQTELKAAELEFREAEFQEALKVLQSINDGDGSSVRNRSTRGEGETLSGWKGKLNLTLVGIGGHSFGTNAALQALKDAPSNQSPWRYSIVFDPGKDSGPLQTNVGVPIFIIDSQEWSGQPTNLYGQEHFDVVKSIAQNSLNKTKGAWFATLLGTSHTSISDIGLLNFDLLKTFSGNASSTLTLPPPVVLSNYVSAANAFLGWMKNGNRTGILASGANYSSYQAFPNASTLNSPWEVHVAPPVNNSTNSTSPGQRSSAPPSRSIASLVYFMWFILGLMVVWFF